ncbi:hypothetical protein DL766_006912 [Monosporascus sp. MC13-8B]|uniref:HNH nuclease domain-containing protein n=1 Tax=Monosporascus cannonballus TaxID=155416 RepID=A0ABY0HF70_9PEZI|nr:hypothetical protein DL762_002755 [Monosporascus cannonballus]RYO99646.1 hypothetical protein DL763_001360 [Monosporascus cannonballus]RYP25819.1 hypothetical protein DL766_006912 [Monosporascus sp. MC13-8B]
MAISSSKAPAGGPPKIPERTSSKRHQEELEEECQQLRIQVEVARRKIKPSHSFDAAYWTSAAEASEVSGRLYEKQMTLAIQQWKGEDDEDDTKGWWSTPEAHLFVDKMKAAQFEKLRYKQQAEKIKQGGSLRRAFNDLFTTSQIGLGVEKAGVGKRTRSQQSKFKSDLIEFYDAAKTHPKKPKIIVSVHDTSTGRWLPKHHVVAAHLVPHSFGGHMLVTLFGANVEGELDTPYNGLLLESAVERAMDDGAIAIVPDLSDDPSTEEVAAWESTAPKNYKWRIIDTDADVLDQRLEAAVDPSTNVMTVQDLDGRQLSFSNDMRPRARYLYFLFVVAQLRLAWRLEYRQDPTKVLAKQLGKGFWATKGRYLKRSFLLALANEIGHDTTFAEDISMPPGDDNDRDDTGLIAIAKMLQFHKKDGDDDEDDDRDDYED